MAAVAGSVADEMLAAMLAGRTLDRAYVNNGGDIALHLAAGPVDARWRSPAPATALPTASSIRAEDPVRGVATSGWRGRSFSLGIADAVTVLARTGAAADAAATIIANAVDLPGHPAITRVPASELAPDSDLGDRLVTTGVGPLVAGEIARGAGARAGGGRGVAAARTDRGGGAVPGRRCTRVCGDASRLGAPPNTTFDEGTSPCLNFRSARSRSSPRRSSTRAGRRRPSRGCARRRWRW